MSAHLVIVKPERGVLKCTQGPHLMPFHVAYSGPAPITTFFRIQEEDTATSESHSYYNSEETLVSTDPGTFLSQQGKSEISSGKHKIASFRGRRLVGLESVLPKNYSGLVLHGEFAGHSHETRRAVMKEGESRKESSRRTRNTRKIGDVDVYDTYEKEEQGEQDLSSTATNDFIRRLQPSEMFSSLTVWNPDIVVDEGQDEYIRTLKEWFTLSSEVHKAEDV